MKRLSRALVLTLLLPLGAPLAEGTQKSVRSGNQISTTPGSADTLAAGGAKIDDHGHEFDEAFLSNKSGGAAADGDVYAIDTASDAGFVSVDTVSSIRKFVVVVDAAIANNAQGKTARSGLVTAKSTGAIARGQWVRKSATAKAIEDAGVAITSAPPTGAVGFSTAAATGGFCAIVLSERTVSGAAIVAWAKATNNGSAFTVIAGSNITSITRNAVGEGTVLFTTATVDANYAVSMMVAMNQDASITTDTATTPPSTTQFRFHTRNLSGVHTDMDIYFIVVR